MPKNTQNAPRSPAAAAPRLLARPVFAQPEPTPDPSVFKIKHPSDAAAIVAARRRGAP
jgi:hypothetical protein